MSSDNSTDVPLLKQILSRYWELLVETGLFDQETLQGLSQLAEQGKLNSDEEIIKFLKKDEG